jgi:hypothetical protein
MKPSRPFYSCEADCKLISARATISLRNVMAKSISIAKQSAAMGLRKAAPRAL